eukprot:363132-Chlamydomonas_euryale.AAC.4
MLLRVTAQTDTDKISAFEPEWLRAAPCTLEAPTNLWLDHGAPVVNGDHDVGSRDAGFATFHRWTKSLYRGRSGISAATLAMEPACRGHHATVVLMAEVVHHFFPKIVELHNYRCGRVVPPTSSWALAVADLHSSDTRIFDERCYATAQFGQWHAAENVQLEHAEPEGVQTDGFYAVQRRHGCDVQLPARSC